MYKRGDLIPLTFCVVCHKITYSDSSVLHMHMNVLQERLEKTKKTKTKKQKKKRKKLQILLIVPLRLTCNQVGDVPVQCSARVM